MKTALLLITFTLSFSAMARVEMDRPDTQSGKNLRSVARQCPKEAKPAYSASSINMVEIAAIGGR